MQDTSVQAMTEVALALSMAFFALLMLALLSMSADQINNPLKSENIESDYLHEVLQSEQGGEINGQYFLFWYAGQFFNQDMKAVQKMDSEAAVQAYLSASKNEEDKVVIVVSQQTPVSEISQLQTLFKTQNFTLTIMTKEWENAFEQQ